MTAFRQGWTLRRRVVALLTVVLVLLLGLATAESLVAATNRQNIDVILIKTGPLRVQGQELMNALLDQETSIRGYAVNGDRKDLAPYEAGLRRERNTVASMRELAGDYPGVLRALTVIEERAAQWRADVAQPVIGATESSGPAAGRELVTDQTRQQFDGIRAAADTLQDEILTVRQQAVERTNRTSNELVVLLIAAALVVAVAGVVLLFFLERMLIRPLAALAGHVRQVADGDYRHHIEASGPPEFRRLAEDIDGMRQKIAQELEEVREARERIEWVNGQLQKQAEELTRSNRDLEQFAYVASHDLQEPLRKVASFCQLLQRRYAGQLDERADQYIAFAVDGAQRMQRLINDLLAFSRIGRLNTGFVEVDLNKVLGDVAAQTEAARQYADAELTWDELPVIRGEEPLLTNLLANLVSNSIKFRRPEVPPRVHVSARLVDGEWEVTCRDNGIGIEPEFADKIFVIFQRLHSRDAYPGTGIGLAIVKKIVEYHGGRVWVDTDAEEGTAIRFTLPALAEADAVPVGRQPDGAAQEGAPEGAAVDGTTGGMKETVG
ncbi:ATP-binding protein [Micromonospora sp. NPDC006766]|uniref:sensor histidine kinase n=1 Tax=Micromonospora sp. NPDC006766 TaxID=3154778 RepID=UPI0033DD96F6